MGSNDVQIMRNALLQLEIFLQNKCLVSKIKQAGLTSAGYH